MIWCYISYGQQTIPCSEEDSGDWLMKCVNIASTHTQRFLWSQLAGSSDERGASWIKLEPRHAPNRDGWTLMNQLTRCTWLSVKQQHCGGGRTAPSLYWLAQRLGSSLHAMFIEPNCLASGPDLIRYGCHSMSFKRDCYNALYGFISIPNWKLGTLNDPYCLSLLAFTRHTFLTQSWSVGHIKDSCNYDSCIASNYLNCWSYCSQYLWTITVRLGSEWWGVWAYVQLLDPQFRQCCCLFLTILWFVLVLLCPTIFVYCVFSNKAAQIVVFH